MQLDKKRIILMHGLAPKPPESRWLELCRKCLIENLECIDEPLAAALERNPDVIRSAYWADATPHHVPDDEEFCERLTARVDEVIQERRDAKKFHVGVGDQVGAFFKARGLDLVNVFTRALTIKDDVMKAVLEETRLYATEQYIADRIRSPLESALQEAWDSGCDVMLITHSMGTFAAYDVLWRFSHRYALPYRNYRDKQVQLFVTLGSPLSDSAVRDLLFARFHKGAGRRQYPTNIRMWHNYVCLGDVVCHGASFEQDYFAGMRSERVIPSEPKHLLIQYENLHNPFRDVDCDGAGDAEKRNPHKEYGYLVQPRLGSWTRDFLRGKLVFGS